MTETIALSAVRDLYAHSGPFASVYFDTRVTGRQEAWPRWRALADDLARHGTAPEVIDVLAAEALDRVPGPGPVALVAAGTDIVLAVTMSGADRPDLAVVGGLPHVLPVLAWQQNHPAAVVAVVDRTGAELSVYPGGAAGAVHRVVNGPDDEIERNAPGGWSQARYQHRAEDSWEHNAVRVAEALARTLRNQEAHLLLLAGDVRALQYLGEHLPGQVRQEVAIRRLAGGRSPDGSAARRAEQIADEVRAAVAEQTFALLDRLEEQRGPDGLAVDGATAVLEALARGRVRTLLLAPDTGAPRTAWYGPEGTDVSTQRAVVARTGARPREGRLVDIAVRAALLTRADVRVVPASDRRLPPDGIAALARF